MRSSSDSIDIAASTQRLHVDNRISLRFYYRIADNILKQVDIFREETNIIDLYIMLLRFSESELPWHRDYRASPQSQKVPLKKKLLNALSELEELKPVVQQKINAHNRKQASQLNGWEQFYSNNLIEMSPVKKQVWLFMEKGRQ